MHTEAEGKRGERTTKRRRERASEREGGGERESARARGGEILGGKLKKKETVGSVGAFDEDFHFKLFVNAPFFGRRVGI
jgi:hypothetical protein